MAASITDLTFRVALITETLAVHPDWQSKLESSGMPASRLEDGRNRLVEALEKIEIIAAQADDHTAVSQVERAVTDVFGWYSTSSRKWRQIVGTTVGEVAWAEIIGEDLDGPDAEFRIIMRAWRLLSCIRTRADVAETIRASKPRLRDELQRGWVLIRKAIKAMNKFHSLKRGERRKDVAAGDLEVVRGFLEVWIDEFGQVAAETFADTLPVLGMLGTVPAGQGIPLGGTAFDVVLHERASAEAPQPVPAEPCSQWGIGASGNKENYWEAEA